MKRIAALAALAVTMIAVPATAAMASTSGSPGNQVSASGYGPPGGIQVACPPPAFLKKHRVHGQVTISVKAYGQAWLKVRRHRGPVPFKRIVCPFIPAKPIPRGCEAQRLVFDMAAGASTMTEVSGPVLSPAQVFSYGGNSYTIISVNPGDDSFTVYQNDVSLYTNPGGAITNGVALLGCSS